MVIVGKMSQHFSELACAIVESLKNSLKTEAELDELNTSLRALTDEVTASAETQESVVVENENLIPALGTSLDEMSLAEHLPSKLVGSILWLLCRLCRRKIEKSSSCLANIEKVEAFIPVLMKTMKFWADSAHVALPSCWLIMLLASDSSSRQKELATAGAPTLVVATMFAHASDADIAEFSCRAARNLSIEDDISAILMENKIGDALQQLMARYVPLGHAAVLEACLWAIVNISCDERAAALLGAAGCCPGLVGAGKVLRDNVHACQAWCSAVRNMSGVDAMNYVRWAETEVCEVLLAVLCEHKQAKDVVEAAYWAVASMACDKEMSIRLTRGGLVDAMVESLQATKAVLRELQRSNDGLEEAERTEAYYLALGPIAESFLWAIRNVAGTEANQSQLGDPRIFVAIQEFLELYSDRPGMVEVVFGTLLNIVDDCSDNQNRLVELGLVPLLAAQLRRHETVVDTVEFGLKLVACSARGNTRLQEAWQAEGLVGSAAKSVFILRGEPEVFRTACEVLLQLHYTSSEQRAELAEKKLLDESRTRSLAPWGKVDEMIALWGIRELAIAAGLTEGDLSPSVGISVPNNSLDYSEGDADSTQQPSLSPEMLQSILASLNLSISSSDETDAV